MYSRIDSRSRKASFYGSQAPLGNAPSSGLSDEEPAADASTSSTVSVDGERPIPSTQIYALASRLCSSASAMANEAEALSGLVAGIGSRIQSYNHLLAGMRLAAQELSDMCPESERASLRPKECRVSSGIIGLQRPHCRPLSQFDTKCPDVRAGAESTARPGEQSGSASSLNFITMPGTPGQCQGHTKDQKSFTKAPRPKALNPAAKRPLSDFNFFCRDARKLVVEAHPEYTKEQVNKELGRIWSMLDHNSRQHYRVMYVQDKQRYSKDVAAQSSVASSTLFKPNGQTTYSSSPIGAGTSNSHNGGSSSARVRNIIWRCATERSCVSTEGPSQMAARSSMEFVVSSSSNNIDDNGAVLNNASSGFLLQRHPANQQVRHPSPMYRSNTIKSILNDSNDYGGAKETTESDDVDEPLARALARGSGRSSNLPSIYHPLREHRLRETAAAMARNQASDS